MGFGSLSRVSYLGQSEWVCSGEHEPGHSCDIDDVVTKDSCDLGDSLHGSMVEVGYVYCWDPHWAGKKAEKGKPLRGSPSYP